MATIALYKDKLNGVGGLIDTMIKSVNDLDVQLGALKSTLQGVDSSTYNLQDTVDSIRSSSKAEKDKIEDLKKLNRKVNEFITTTVKRDNSAKDEINKEKKDFYKKYSYLKPDCEKTLLDNIVDTLESAGEWCAKHWKLVATVVIAIVAVVLIATGIGTGIGVTILTGMLKGLIMGAVIGGVAGGIQTAISGGSFSDILKGILGGALSGAVDGAFFGAIFGLGNVAGPLVKCRTFWGYLTKGTAAVTAILSLGMAGFDMAASVVNMFDSNNILVRTNSALHENKAYNFFQNTVNVIAAFTGGMSKTMTCFVAGTLVLTESGLTDIEKIKAGDIVLSVETDTMKKSYKKVLETYVREVKELVHLMID